MKRASAIFLVVLGLLFLGVGLLFFVGAKGMASRYLIGALGLLFGAVGTGLGIRIIKRADRLRPGFVRAEILELARRKNGELSELDIRAKLEERFDSVGRAVLEELEKETCRRTAKGGTVYYSFPDLHPRLTMRRCEFCQAEIPLEDDLISCPQCGGTIKTGVQRLSVSDEEYYSLDSNESSED